MSQLRYLKRVELMELIDTLWNVNFPVPHASLMALLELIDTLWNVNATFDNPERCSP